MADLLGLSVPHLNRTMQQLRGEKLIATRRREVAFIDAGAMQTLAHYQPQALSPNPTWNKAAEEYFARWAARCEVTNRFCFAECQALVCRGMDIDGEYFVHKTRSADGLARLQLIEAHRIHDCDRSDTEDGIGFDAYGAPSFYRVQLDDGTFRNLPASIVLHVFEPESASGVRNMPER